MSCSTSTVPPGPATVSLVTFCVATVHFVSPTHSTAGSDLAIISFLKRFIAVFFFSVEKQT